MQGKALLDLFKIRCCNDWGATQPTRHSPIGVRHQ